MHMKNTELCKHFEAVKHVEKIVKYVIFYRKYKTGLHLEAETNVVKLHLQMAF